MCPPKRLHRARVIAAAAIAFATCCGVLPTAASAHVPVLEPRAANSASAGMQLAGGVPISPPSASTAVYGTIAPGESADAYVFTPVESFEASVELLVPSGAATAEFHPHLVLYERGSKVGEASWDGAPQTSFFEPFSLQRFRTEVTMPASTFEQGVPYTVAVTAGSGEALTGPYVVVFGGPERFTSADVRASLTAVPRIWFGLYGQWSVRWGMVAGAAALVALIACAIAGGVRRRGRKRRIAKGA